MIRSERLGFGVSTMAHAALLVALSIGWLAAPKVIQPPDTAVDVSLVDEVALEAATQAPDTAPPPASEAPDLGSPEPSPAAMPKEPVPVPVPAKPVAAPVERPALSKPAPAKPAPLPTPVKPKSPPKPVTAQPSSAKAPPRSKPATLSATATATATATQPRGSRLGPDFLKGISDRAAPSTNSSSAVGKIGPREMAGLADAIRRQVQPCADRITSPGPGSNSITTKLNLRLNRDGSFVVRPQVLSQSGVTDDNNRYARRVGELAAAAFIQCAPFNLPDALFDGWKNININYKLPD